MNVGDLINDQYLLQERLGAGGFAIVWRAKDVSLGREVALKFLQTNDGEMLRRFRREARALGQLQHANCVQVYDSGTADGTPFLALELVDGYALSTRRGERLPIAEIESIARQVTSALVAAHEHGIVHRDLKPENVMVTERNGQLAVKVLDFGIAKVALAELPDITKTGQLLGTPHFMSPEQLRGSRHVGPASDQYSFGVMLFELLEGRLLFDGPDLLTIAVGHLETRPPEITRGDCPEYLRQIVARLLVKDAGGRFPNARALEVAFRTQSMPTVAAEELRAAPPRSPVPVAGAVLAAVLLMALVVALVPGSNEPKSPVPRPLPQPVLAPALEVVPSHSVDTGFVDVVEEPAGSDGCGKKAYDLGLQFFGDKSDGLTRFVPTDYDPDKRYPMILVLRGGNEDGFTFVKTSGLLDVARAHGVVVLAPDRVDGLKPEEVVSTLQPVVDQERANLCIDPSRIYVVAQGNRGGEASILRCEPWVRAIALHAHRLDTGSKWPRCKGGRQTPVIAMWPMKSREHPREGGDRPGDCGKERRRPLRSIASMEELLSAYTGSSSKPSEPTVERDGTCVEFPGGSAFKSCYLEGGIAWPGTPIRKAYKMTGPGGNPMEVSPGLQGHFDNCDGKPSNFPAARVVWDFFSSLDV